MGTITNNFSLFNLIPIQESILDISNSPNMTTPPSFLTDIKTNYTLTMDCYFSTNDLKNPMGGWVAFISNGPATGSSGRTPCIQLSPSKQIVVQHGFIDHTYGVSAGPVAAGSWFNVTITVTDSRMTLYINGVKVGEHDYKYVYGSTNSWKWGYNGPGVGADFISNGLPAGTLKVANVYYLLSILSPENIKTAAANPGKTSKLSTISGPSSVTIQPPQSTTPTTFTSNSNILPTQSVRAGYSISLTVTILFFLIMAATWYFFSVGTRLR